MNYQKIFDKLGLDTRFKKTIAAIIAVIAAVLGWWQHAESLRAQECEASQLRAIFDIKAAKHDLSWAQLSGEDKKVTQKLEGKVTAEEKRLVDIRKTCHSLGY